MNWSNYRWAWGYYIGEQEIACLLCNIGRVPVLVSDKDFDEAEAYASDAGLTGGHARALPRKLAER